MAGIAKKQEIKICPICGKIILNEGSISGFGSSNDLCACPKGQTTNSES